MSDLYGHEPAGSTAPQVATGYPGAAEHVTGTGYPGVPGHAEAAGHTAVIGHAGVDAALAELARCAELPPAEQVSAYEAAHRSLLATLATIDQT